MAASPSVNPVVTNTAIGGTLAGIVTLVAALAASVTKTGFNLSDALAALSGAGVSVGSVAALVFHHNAALARDAALVASKVPELTEMRGDLDVLGVSVRQVISDVAPGAVPKLAADLAKARSDIAGLAAELEARAGTNPTQVKAWATEAVHDLFSAIPPAAPPAPNSRQD